MHTGCDARSAVGTIPGDEDEAESEWEDGDEDGVNQENQREIEYDVESDYTSENMLKELFSDDDDDDLEDDNPDDDAMLDSESSFTDGTVQSSIIEPSSIEPTVDSLAPPCIQSTAPSSKSSSLAINCPFS